MLGLVSVWVVSPNTTASIIPAKNAYAAARFSFDFTMVIDCFLCI